MTYLNFMIDINHISRQMTELQINDLKYMTVIFNLDEGKKLICLCEILKAFDRMWRNGISYKLRHYGISEQIIFWINNTNPGVP